MWLSDLSIKRPVFITMVTVALAVLGLLAYNRMPVDLFPAIDVPVVAVQTVYAGATPQEVESLVTKPLEQAVSSLAGVEKVSSTSAESVSMVIVEFEIEHDLNRAMEDVRERVNSVLHTLPDDIETPVYHKFDPSTRPMLSIAVADRRGVLNPARLREVVQDDVADEIMKAPGVASAEVVGGLVSEVQVNLQLDRLQALSLPVQQVTTAIKQQNLNIPGGKLTVADQENLLRLSGQFVNIVDIGEVPITTPMGVTVYLKDVAEIREGYKDVRVINRLNGSDSIVIFVQKQSGTNTVQVADAVKERLRQIGMMKPELEIAVIDDQSIFTRQSTEDVIITLIMGGIMAALVVFAFFRDVRNTLITVAGLPIIVIGAFQFMDYLGFSLNMISLLALSISIGMLVDDAIVVRENIFRHTQEGMNARQAASFATGEIALAVLATTMTIVAVFFPVALVGGIGGRFLKEFGLTIIVAVLISMFEAFTLAPMLSAYFFSTKGKNQHKNSEESVGQVSRVYRRGLGWALSHRGVVVLLGVLAVAGSVGVLMLLPKSFIRDIDRGQVTINLEMPSGTTLAQMDEMSARAEKLIMAYEHTNTVVATIGSESGGTERASLLVNLKSDGQLDRFQRDMRAVLPQTNVMRFDIDVQANSLAGMMMPAQGSIAGRPVTLHVKGDNLKDLDTATRQIMDAIATVPGAVDIDRSLKSGSPELQIVMDRPVAADLSISTGQIGSTVRTLVNGEVVSRYTGSDKDKDITVRLRPEDRQDVESIERLPLLSPKGGLVPLSAVAKLEPAIGPSVIQRSDRQRVVTVGASYVGRELGSVVNDVEAELDKLQLPAGVTWELGGTAQYMESVFNDLLFALVLAVVFVYMILASEFESFIHPFTIMLALPLSFLGAFVLLYVTGESIDMIALIGIILLMGLVTKNSILLVDYTNTLRRRGMERNAAVLRAGPVRLRPILMTTIAMISGMLPLAFGYGAGGNVRKPMAIAVIGGLITSTVLTLVVVPVAYTLIDDFGERVKRMLGRSSPMPQPLPATAAVAASEEQGGEAE